MVGPEVKGEEESERVGERERGLRTFCGKVDDGHGARWSPVDAPYSRVDRRASTSSWVCVWLAVVSTGSRISLAE